MITLTKSQAITIGVVAGVTFLGFGTGMYFAGKNKGQKQSIDAQADRVVKRVTSKFEAAISQAIKDNIGEAATMIEGMLTPKDEPSDEKPKKK